MSEQKDIIKRTFERRLKEAGRGSRYGTVKEVDEKKRLCKVQVGGIVYDDVLLYAQEKESLKGFVAIPAKDSIVIVQSIEGSSQLFVSMTSVIDKLLLTIEDISLSVSKDGIAINGGELGAMVKIKALEDNLKSLKSFVEAMNTAIPSAFTAVGAGAAAAGASGNGSYTGAMAGKSIDLADMADEKVKH